MGIKNIEWIGRLIAGMAILLALVACGDDESDETPPALTLDPVFSPALDESVLLSGTVERGASLEARIDSEAVPNADFQVVEDEGPFLEWSVLLESFPLGTHVVEISASDATENISIQRFALRKPALLLGPLPRLTPFSDQPLTGLMRPGLIVTVNGNETLEGEMIQVDGTEWQKWRYELALPEGSTQITVSAQEGDSVRETVTQRITVDPEAPFVSIDDTLPLIVTEASILLRGEVDEGAQLEVGIIRPGSEELDPLESPDRTNGSWTVAADLEPGLNKIVATADDGENVGQALLDIVFRDSLAVE